jgi:GNAT superfamily N-acetyltransferase
MIAIHTATSDADIAACFPVMSQLRPHLVADEFVARVRAQQAEGFRLAWLEDEGHVRAVAGYRFIRNLVSGQTLYVDDLVTDAQQRSRGYGRMLFEWLVADAQRHGCQAVDLDSGVQRFDAHRFYLTNRMAISAHHFKLML